MTLETGASLQSRIQISLAIYIVNMGVAPITQLRMCVMKIVHNFYSREIAKCVNRDFLYHKRKEFAPFPLREVPISKRETI